MVNIARPPGPVMTVSWLVAGSYSRRSIPCNRTRRYGAYFAMGVRSRSRQSDSSRKCHSFADRIPLFHHYLGTGLSLALPTLLTGGAMSVGALGQTRRLDGHLAHTGFICFVTVRDHRKTSRYGSPRHVLAPRRDEHRLLPQAYRSRTVSRWRWSRRSFGSHGSQKDRKCRARGPRRIGKSLLMTVRPQSIIIASPAIVLWATSLGGRTPCANTGLVCPAFLGAPLALGFLIVLQFNHWMTGEWTRSPYYFGNDQFKSVELTAPYLRLVLLILKRACSAHLHCPGLFCIDSAYPRPSPR